MSRSGIPSQFVITVIFITAAPFVLAISAKSCESDSDCLHPYFTDYVPEENREICSNGTCTCPPDYIGAEAWSDLKACHSPLISKNQSCSDHSACEDGERCSPDSTCVTCSMGKFSSTADTCEEPVHDETCVFMLHIGVDDVRFKFQKACQGEGLLCDTYGSKKCTCRNSEYYDQDLKKCSSRPGLGEDCNKSKPCTDDPDSFGYTKCGKNNTCVCVGIVKAENGYCLQKPTARCRNNYQCPEHSSCIGSYGEECVCGPGYVDSREGECLRFMSGSSCESDPDSKTLRALNHQGLECINGFYQCAKPMEQYYDVGPEGEWHWSRWRHICVTEAGANCTGIDDTRCTDRASCTDVKGQFACKCDRGYSVTPDNKCLKHVEFGAKCTNDCNNFAGLICQHGVCGCLDSTMMYDSGSRKCLSPEDHFCGSRVVGGVKVKIGCQGGLKCRVPEGAVHEGLRCLKNDFEKTPLE